MRWPQPKDPLWHRRCPRSSALLAFFRARLGNLPFDLCRVCSTLEEPNTYSMASGRRAPLRALLVGLGCLAVTVLVIQGTGRTNVALLSVPDENVVGSLGVQADDVAGALGALDDVSLTRRDNVNIDGVLGSVDAMKGSTSAAAMKQDMNTFFDKIPVRDVEHGNSAPRAVSRASSPWGQLEDSPEHEWAAKLKNMEAAVKIAHEKGDAALEEAVNKGLTRPGGEQAAMQSSDASMRTRAANSNRLLASMARKLGGIDGSRAKHLANDVSGLKSSLRKEHSIMSRLKAEVAVRDELKAKHSVLASEKMSTKSLEQQAHALADSVQDAAQTIASKTADLTKARTELERAEEVIRDALESNQVLFFRTHKRCEAHQALERMATAVFPVRRLIGFAVFRRSRLQSTTMHFWTGIRRIRKDGCTMNLRT
jgi:hypothetical protein